MKNKAWRNPDFPLKLSVLLSEFWRPCNVPDSPQPEYWTVGNYATYFSVIFKMHNFKRNVYIQKMERKDILLVNPNLRHNIKALLDVMCIVIQNKENSKESLNVHVLFKLISWFSEIRFCNHWMKENLQFEVMNWYVISS